MEQSTGRNKVTRHSPRPHGPSSRATSLSTLLIPQGYMQGRVDREPPAVECHPLFFFAFRRSHHSIIHLRLRLLLPRGSS